MHLSACMTRAAPGVAVVDIAAAAAAVTAASLSSEAS